MADEPKFELHLIRRDVTVDPAAAKRKKDREDGRQKAQVFAEEALQQMVALMRNDPDSKIRLQAAKYVMDRAWGTPKAIEDESQAQKNKSIIEVLAGISAEFAQIERVPAEMPENSIKIEQESGIEALLLPGDENDT